jgi:beta-glucosidase
MKHQDIISKMTLEEKASLMSGKTVWETQDIKKLGLKSIFLSDGPTGLRKQAGASDQLGLNASLPATCFPTTACTANSWNPAMGEEVGKALGEEAKDLEANVVLGPGLNMKRNPLGGRNFEYFAEDPYLAGKMAASYARGIQSNGVASCVKHFCCNNQELKREEMDTIVDERTLREIYLTGFEIAVKEGGAKCVMSSYNMINGQYANENQHTMVDILRNEWKFDGVVITDWGGNNDRIEGVKCFNSLEMPTTAGETNREIVKAVKDGKLDEKILDQNVDCILDLILDTSKATEEGRKEFDKAAHNKVAEKAAEESMVLLKNDGILPLKKEDKVAVIGDFAFKPRYQGAGSSLVNATMLESALDVLKKDDIKIVGSARGFKRYGGKSNKLLKEAVKVAKDADVLVLYLGLHEFSEVEGIDRTSMKMPENQLELVKELKKLNKKIVVVLSCGSAVEMDFEPDANAILLASLSGQAGAEAGVNILYGKISPSGKLSETIPYKYEDCSSANYFKSVAGKEITAEYREGPFIGYRYYDTANVKPRYPFGFGLSYAKFDYADLTVTEDGVAFTIKNSGAVVAKEIAELYIGKKDSKIIRPKKELKGFAKIELKPGEEKKVEIPFDDKSFRYFNTADNRWEVEEGTYEIYIGASSEDIRLSGTIEQKGIGTHKLPYDISELPSYQKGEVKNVSDAEFSKLLGHEIPPHELTFIKKNRIVVTPNTTMSDLRYARGWTGRFFARAVRHAVGILNFFGNKGMANALVMGVQNQVVRVLSRMTNGMMSWGQLEGLLMMFNGHYHKGLGHMISEGHKKKKLNKEIKKQKKAEEEAEKKADAAEGGK